MAYYEVPGDYSVEVISSPVGESQGAAALVGCRRVESLGANECDLLISDPPYGFNTEESLAAGARLYWETAQAFMRALRPGGHLVVALPEQSFTGRWLPWYTNYGLFVHQLRLAAQLMGKRLVQASNEVPIERWLFVPPFYWESEKALRRVILWFRVEQARDDG